MSKSFAYFEQTNNKVENFKITNHLGADSLLLPAYISTTGRTKKEYRVDWSANEKCFIVYSEKGCGKILLNGEWQMMPEGSLAYIPTTEPVIYEPVEGIEWTTSYITFGGRMAESIPEVGACIITSPEFDFFPGIISSFFEKHNQPDWDEYSRTVLYYVLLKLRKLSGDVSRTISENSPVKSRLIYSVKYITEHFSHDLPIPFLAKMCSITEEYYCKQFKKLTGKTPIAYISALRVSHACDLLLKHPNDSIETVSAACGFRSPTYFSKVFKKETGMTPGEFRKRNGSVL